MKKAIRLVVLTIVVLTAGLMATSCVPKTVSPTDLADPVKIFANDCASCHAADRTGGHGPNITAPKLTDYTQISLAEFLTTHKTAKNLTVEQRSIMAAWLKIN